MPKNDVITAVIKRCRDEKKEAKEKQIDSEKKLMIPEQEISECPEYEAKSKIGNIFVNEKIKNILLKFMKIDPYFYEHYKKYTS